MLITEIDDVILSKRDIGKKLIVENKLKKQEEYQIIVYLIMSQL